MQKVEIISPTKLQTNHKYKLIKLKVAAYCRVSTDSEEQLNSYESQIKYYTAKINDNPDWTNAGIYADEGISGTQVKNRTDFLRMIKDAEDGKIDLILVKSISRFGRNTVDILKYIRKLKALNVAIYFEEENINTMQMQGEILITVLSALAQQGSATISSSSSHGNKMKMQRGELVGLYAPFGYRYSEDEENLVIVDDEAEIVRTVFDLYVSGLGSSKVAQKMNQAGIPTPHGKKWRDTTVLDMLHNEKYVGDLLTGKSYTVDPIEHIRVKNNGEKEKYYTKEHHEGIISREVYDEAMSILEKRSSKYYDDSKNPVVKGEYAFSSKIECGFCGQNYYRWKRTLGKDKHDVITWVCSTKKQKKNGMVDKLCDNLNYRQETIEQAFINSYSSLCKNNKEVIERLLNVMEDVLTDESYEREQKKLENQLLSLQQKQSSLVDMRLENKIDEKLYLEKYNDISKKIDLFGEKICEYQKVRESNKNIKSRINHFKRIFESQKILKEFSRDVFEIVVEKIIIGKIEEDGTKNPNYIKFVLNSGTEVINQLPDRKVKNGTTLGDKSVAQNNVSIHGNSEWLSRITSYGS